MHSSQDLRLCSEKRSSEAGLAPLEALVLPVGLKTAGWGLHTNHSAPRGGAQVLSEWLYHSLPDTHTVCLTWGPQNLIERRQELRAAKARELTHSPRGCTSAIAPLSSQLPLPLRPESRAIAPLTSLPTVFRALLIASDALQKPCSQAHTTRPHLLSYSRPPSLTG